MYLAKESIDTITDMATRLSIHEDVLRAHMGITDDDKEQYYICALQSDSARASAPAEHPCLGDADVASESNLGAALAFASALDSHEQPEINLIQKLEDVTGWFHIDDVTTFLRQT